MALISGWLKSSKEKKQKEEELLAQTRLEEEEKIKKEAAKKKAKRDEINLAIRRETEAAILLAERAKYHQEDAPVMKTSSENEQDIRPIIFANDEKTERVTSFKPENKNPDDDGSSNTRVVNFMPIPESSDEKKAFVEEKEEKEEEQVISPVRMFTRH